MAIKSKQKEMGPQAGGIREQLARPVIYEALKQLNLSEPGLSTHAKRTHGGTKAAGAKALCININKYLACCRCSVDDTIIQRRGNNSILNNKPIKPEVMGARVCG